MSSRRVTLVLATTSATPEADASVHAFSRQLRPHDELILVGPHAHDLALGLGHVHRVLAPAQDLVPILWREGLKKSDATFVAFSTTQMVPCANWLDTLTSKIEDTNAVGGGGRIAPLRRLRLVDRAVYLQRFARYGPELLPRRPSGENCLYRRDCLLAVSDSWRDGFWELEVQDALECQRPRPTVGDNWVVVPEALVHFQGRTQLAATMRQRLSHALRYGSIRSAEWGRGRKLLGLFITPLVPLLLLNRAFAHLFHMRSLRMRWVQSIPWFLAIAGAWAIGESLAVAKGKRDKTINPSV